MQVPFQKQIGDIIINYIVEHHDEIIAKAKAALLDFLGKIDADKNGKQDLNETADDIHIAFDRLYAALQRTKAAVATYGVKKKP